MSIPGWLAVPDQFLEGELIKPAPPKHTMDANGNLTLNPDWQAYHGTPGLSNYVATNPGMVAALPAYAPLFTADEFATPEAYQAALNFLIPFSLASGGPAAMVTGGRGPDFLRATGSGDVVDQRGRNPIYGMSGVTMQNWIINNPEQAAMLYFALAGNVDPASGAAIESTGSWLAPNELRMIEMILGPERLDETRRMLREMVGLPPEPAGAGGGQAPEGDRGAAVQGAAEGSGSQTYNPNNFQQPGFPPLTRAPNPRPVAVPEGFTPDRSAAVPVAVPQTPTAAPPPPAAPPQQAQPAFSPPPVAPAPPPPMLPGAETAYPNAGNPGGQSGPMSAFVTPGYYRPETLLPVGRPPLAPGLLQTLFRTPFGRPPFPY